MRSLKFHDLTNRGSPARWPLRFFRKHRIAVARPVVDGHGAVTRFSKKSVFFFFFKITEKQSGLSHKRGIHGERCISLRPNSVHGVNIFILIYIAYHLRLTGRAVWIDPVRPRGR